MARVRVTFTMSEEEMRTLTPDSAYALLVTALERKAARVAANPARYSRRRSIDDWRSAVTADPAGCLLWEGSIDRHGYGRWGGSDRPGGNVAHRRVWELEVGPIPDGLVLDHLCRNRGCVNPAHLEPVTPRENTLRGNGASARNARKTHCKNGHEYTPENTTFKDGGRACRTCLRAYRVDLAERKRLAAKS